MTEYVYWLRGEKHRDMAALSIASVRQIEPRALVSVYSDDPELEPLPGCVWTRLEPGEPPMVANVTAQARHLATAQYGAEVIFLDADVLVRQRLPFDGADLVVTWRDHVAKKGEEKIEGAARIMPYNYGVIGAVASRYTIEAFTWLRWRVLNMADCHQQWYGNQFALYELCGSRRNQNGKVPIPWSPFDNTPKLHVHRLPCEVWNYTPEGPGEDVSGRGILHFKGGRKDMMEAYT